MGTSNFKIQSFLVLISRVLGIGLSFLNTFLLARFLGARDLGFYTLALSVASTGTIISQFGFENPLVRLSAKYKVTQNIEEIRGLIIIVSIFVLFVSLAISILLILGAGFISKNIFHKPEISTLIILISGSVIFLSFFNIFKNVLRGIEQGDRAIFLSNLVAPSCSIIFFLLLFYFGRRTSAAAIAYLFSSFIIMTLSLLFIHKSIRIFDVKKFPSFKEVIHDSFEFFILGTINSIQNWLGIYIIGMLLASEDVGVFKVASSIAILISLPLESVNTVLPPAIVNYHSTSQTSRLQDILSDNSRWIMAISLPIFIIVILFPQYILYFFGKDFTTGKYVLIILSLGYLFNSFMGTVGLVLRMTDNQKYIIKARIIVFIMSIGLYYYFTKAYGVIGAAFVSTAVIIAMNIWNTISMYKLLGIRSFTFNLKDLLLANILATIVMLSINLIFRNTLLSLFVFSITYLLMTKKTIFKGI